MNVMNVRYCQHINIVICVYDVDVYYFSYGLLSSASRLQSQDDAGDDIVFVYIYSYIYIVIFFF